MTVVQIILGCNGPVTDVGPISNCPTTYAARSWTVEQARGYAAREGWSLILENGHAFADLCPEHSQRLSPDARATGA